MKPFCFLLLFSISMQAAAQSLTEDSARMVVLQNISITTKQKSQQQHLYNFFMANKAATTEDVLARFPELSLIRRGSYGMEPVIRSFNSNQVQLLLDGMRIHGACTDKMDPASIYIEPVNLASIEVTTGGRGFLNGSSIGGSINMKLAEAGCHDEKRFSGSASSSYHSVARSFHQSVHMNYATPKWGLRASGTYRKSAAYRDGSGKTVAFSQLEKANLALNGRLLLNNTTYLKLDLLADDGWNIGYPALPMDVGYAAARIGAVSIVSENPSPHWEKLEAKLYANRVRHYMDDTRRPDVPVHMDMPGESTTRGFYAEGSKKTNKGKLTLRADASATDLSASMTMYQPGQLPMFMLTWPHNRQVQSGMATEYIIRIDSNLQMRLHARADLSVFSMTSQMAKDQLAVFNHSGDNRRFFIPSISVHISRNLGGSVKGSMSLGINGRTPTAAELFGFYLFNQFDGYDYVGNPALAQESGLQGELSLSVQQRKWKVQATAYVSGIRNYILGQHAAAFSAMTIGARGVKQYVNIDHAIVSGAEASIVWQPFVRMQLVSTVKYAFGKDYGGAPLPMITPLRSVSSLRYHFSRLWIQAETEMAAAQHRVSADAGERPTGSFILYHIRAGHQVKVGQVEFQLSAGVENLFDLYYREHLDWGNMARPGRNMYVQAAVKL